MKKKKIKKILINKMYEFVSGKVRNHLEMYGFDPKRLKKDTKEFFKKEIEQWLQYQMRD